MISFAFATPNFTWGGAEIHILWLAAGVTRARCAGVAVSGYGGVDPLMAAELVKHCPLVGDTHKSPRPFAPGLACDGFPDFPAAVRHACRDADVLLTWGSLQVARFTQGLGIPVVVISHCSVPHGSVCDGATHLVGVSEVALEPFRGVRGAESLPVRVLYNGANAARLVPAQGREAQRVAWGAGADDVVVLFTGRQAGEKNPEAVVRALSALPAHYKGAFYGWDSRQAGRPKPELVEMAAALAPGRVCFCDPVSRLGDAFAGADVFMIPSYRETNSLGLLEAFLAGVPAVATRVGAVPEFERDFGPLVVPVHADDPPEALAAAVRIAASETGAMLARRARAVASARWTTAHMCRDWEDYLEEVVRE